jgi:hypothetical protein
MFAISSISRKKIDPRILQAWKDRTERTAEFAATTIPRLTEYARFDAKKQLEMFDANVQRAMKARHN